MKSIAVRLIPIALLLLITASLAVAQEKSTYARFVPERADDFAWENDYAAFRAYGPGILKTKGKEDSGIDCWLKRVPYPIINSWYDGDLKGKSYHVDHGEGYDPYHVGGSRGCGGTALWQNGAMVTSGPYVAYRVLEHSKEQTVFELDYMYPADKGLSPIKEVKRISIGLGEPFFHAQSTFTRDGKPLADLPVAIGITTHDGKAKPTFDSQKRWMSCWEEIDQAGLGTGVALDKGFDAEMTEIQTHGQDTGHALMITKTNPEGMVSYWAGYGWKKADHYKTSSDWEKALQEKSK